MQCDKEFRFEFGPDGHSRTGIHDKRKREAALAVGVQHGHQRSAARARVDGGGLVQYAALDVGRAELQRPQCPHQHEAAGQRGARRNRNGHAGAEEAAPARAG